jgi:phosphoribosylamine--glycine ligase
MQEEDSFKMKVLVVGSGGREHTLVWKLAQSPRVEAVYAAPGNGGIAALAECVPVSASDTDGLLTLVREKEIDLTVVGPEAPLVAGIVDLFRSHGLAIFGFDSGGARLEGSKVWAKQFMKRYGIPTGTFTVCETADAAISEIDAGTPPFVVKADGLASRRYGDAEEGVRQRRRQDSARGIS